MKRQSVITQKKKRRGPLPTGKGELIGVRLQPFQLAALDEWIARQESARTRPEGIRHLMDLALSISASHRPTSKAKAEKAAELAAHAIEKASDKSQSTEEQKTRKRKLISGPSEFRDIRRDQAKRRGEWHISDGLWSVKGEPAKVRWSNRKNWKMVVSRNRQRLGW